MNPANWCALRLGLVALVLAGGRIYADVIVNNAQPITKRVTVQIVQTAASDGSNAAPMFGNAAQQQAIFEMANQIWAQAGVEIAFKFRAGTWNWDFALTGSPGNNSPRPGSDVATIVTAASQLSVTDPNPTVINLYLLRIVPGFSQMSDNTCAGQSLTGQNGVTLWVGPNTPATSAGRDLVAHVLAHEIGHNLGLVHVTESQDLMQANYSPGELLNTSQAAAARGSAFALNVAESETKPWLAITSPVDPYVTLQSSITLQGTAFDARGISGVMVGNTPAVSSDGFATWTATCAGLSAGQNVLSVVAADKVTPANTTSIPWHVYYATDLTDADGDGLPDAWEFANGLSLFDDGSLSADNGPLGDPNHDGIPNLLEYALNGDPQKPNSAMLPATVVETNAADGKRYLGFIYHRRINATGILYSVEVSSDLKTWTADPLSIEEAEPSAADANGITETVHLRIRPALGDPENSAKFVRLRVSTAP
jgi:hypothetical protein